MYSKFHIFLFLVFSLLCITDYGIAVITKGMIFNQYHLEHEKHQHITCPHKMQTIKIAAIIPNDTSHMFSIMKTRPVIAIGLSIVYHFNLLPCHNLTVKYADSKCSNKDGPLAAIDFYTKKDVHVFLGPVCDFALAPVARYADAWNIPIISTGGFAYDFGIKTRNMTLIGDETDTFPTLTRVHLTFISLADFITTVIKYHDWHQIKIIYNRDGHGKVESAFCHLAMSAFVERVTTEGPNIVYDHYRLHAQEDDFDTVFMEEIANRYAGNHVRNCSQIGKCLAF